MRALLVGFGVTNQAVADALLQRGHEVVVCDDESSPAVRVAAGQRNVDLVDRPSDARLKDLVRSVDAVLPSPGAPITIRSSPQQPSLVYRFAASSTWRRSGMTAPCWPSPAPTARQRSRRWRRSCSRPPGVRAAAAGNNETPLVQAIDDPTVDVFVVEASSFRLAHTERFVPLAATWLNFAPDHLTAHASIGAYENAKARIWRDLPDDDPYVAIGNADDPVVERHLEMLDVRTSEFSIVNGACRWARVGDQLVDPGGGPFLSVAELQRAFPHDVSNALAATATVLDPSVGATYEGVCEVLRTFGGLPHRITLVGERDGVSWYDDSKATTPNAALAAVRAFDSVVLIAGGQNKGLDLSALAGGASHIRAVVAIGDAADEVSAAFAGVRPVSIATSMAEAIERAGAAAEPGDVVLLSPACASFDWYRSYGERGDDFSAQVRSLIGASA